MPAPATQQPVVVKSGGGAMVPLLIIGSLGAGYAFILRPWLNKRAAMSKLVEDQKSTIRPKPGKVLKDLTGKPTTSANLSTIVFELERALNFPTDQDRAIAVFRSIPWGYVKKVEEMYMDKFGENLKQRLNKKLSDENWIKIKYTFE